MTTKENQLYLCDFYGFETLQWQKGASLVIDFINTEIPLIIKVEGIFPSLIYLEAVEKLLRKKVARRDLEPHERYRVEVINTSNSAHTILTSFKFKSIQKIASNVLEKNR
ncbi:hypothetical protein MTZ49_10930 [Entomomonas sp. E2T0]|uniref:hypothetical protein n=1 Tax=Entomomonas sp. E2T0 TaxID=2930213 RepID=UPI0022284B2C|nr:hypothetical protein [Entomomonas sp. E2T0]UYZ83113.1 hypothetical protein MTZ49_10930 [Entomomonas sp. E2T0]